MTAIEKPKHRKQPEDGDRLRSSRPEKKKMNPLSPHPHPFKKAKYQMKNKKGSVSGGKNPNFIPLGDNKILAEKRKKEDDDDEEEEEKEEKTTTSKKKKKKGEKQKGGEEKEASDDVWLVSTAPAEQQLSFLLDRFQSASKIKLSPLELEAFKDNYMVELAEGREQDVDNFSEHMKAVFGHSWKEQLTEGKLSEGLDEGSPALLIVSASALSSLELLRGLKSLTRECRPAKLFAKHMKVEEQVALLKNRVNIAAGTPSRIKKLIDMEALSLTHLSVVVLDMRRDVKGYSLFTLPQVSAEFWDLYKSHLQPRLLQGNMRICFYGAVPKIERKKAIKSNK